jgi:aspartate aminotransferase
MKQLSDRLNRLSPSATLAMSQKSSELKAQGIDIINMSVGEPDFNTPDHIKEAAHKAIDENFSRYSPVPGYPELKNAIVAKLKNENHLDYSAAQILCSNGAKQSVCNTIMAVVNAGDEVIIPAPYWVSYPQMVLLAEGTPVFVEAEIEQDFKITPAQLEAAITPKTRALILCSPSNPTGSVYSKEELAALAEVLKKHERVIVIADEIYEHINYVGKHESIAQFPEMKERTVIINGVSKAYAMTGWRIGFIAAPEWIVKGCNKLQGQYTSGPCSVSQKAAEAAYTGSQECVEVMRQAFERRKNLIVKLAKEIPGLKVNNPQGAFYLFPDCSNYFGKKDGDRVINTSTDFAMYLLEVGHVATVGGDAFGSPKCFRMSYATSDENITEALRRIKEACARLK